MQLNLKNKFEVSYFYPIHTVCKNEKASDFSDSNISENLVVIQHNFPLQMDFVSCF